LSERPGFYFGWIIAVSAGALLLVTNGMTLGGLSVYDEVILGTLQEATGRESMRGELNLRAMITFWGSGVLAPIAGAIADRIGVRPLMVVGLVLLAGGYFAYGTINSLGQIYGIHAAFALTLATCGLVVNVMLVSKWFVRNRGLAIGIALAGTSLGNATLAPLNAWLIQELGWRSAFQWTAILPLLMVPLVLFVVREQPAELSRERPAEMAPAAKTQVTGLSYGEALRTANFWILALIAMCTFYSILGMSAHVYLHMRGAGFGAQVAALGQTVMFTTGLAGKIGSGVLADAFGRKRIFITTLACMCAGAWLIPNTGAEGIWVALLLFGLGWGGLYTLLQLLAADYFGVRHLGKILGTITVLDTFGGGLGPFVTGLLYDQSGSYSRPFTIIAVLVTVALVLATRYRTAPAAA
jgi:MFS family permease